MRLSLVIPVYNEEDTIAACLEHVAAQIRPFDEVLVVDNNCTDATMAIVASFADRLPLKTLTERTPGVGPARRAGFDAATGDILGRIDADTWLDPQWAGRLVRFFEAEPTVDAVSGSLYWYDTPVDERLRRLIRKDACRSLRTGSVRSTVLQGSNMAIRREMWHKAKGHLLDQPGTHEDLDLYGAVVKAEGNVRSFVALTAAQSARRFAGPIGPNIAYARGGIRTYKLHGDTAAARNLRLAFPMNVTFCVIMRVLVGPFDPVTRKWRPFRGNHAVRVSPMEGTRSH
ncbi:glycosyltransferase family 2 protein [Gordonia rubripertincta]|uniref:glycosyltransferase family 2 protein n=1 Tax=Gordonia rubripertincta TaxID=36822 RepID=UPI001443968B|nr:glycosyltransferase family A protein [Gordonia rubripertincta]NKY64871.1 glycosyltransferase family 2 protein [Gordonia rubripertincta]